MSRQDSRREPRFEDAPRAGPPELRATRPGREGAGATDHGRSASSDNPRPAPRRRRKGRGLVGGFIYWSFVAAVWALLALGGVVTYYAMKLPPIDQLAVPKRPPNVAILAADGSLIANRGETGGQAIPIGELPAYLPKAFVAIEDKRFYDHFGIDAIGLTRAVLRNLTSRRLEQGGSTLTQQLAKNVFLTQERTLSRKVQEAILALWLERSFSKDQILELYLNRVYFGSGAYGVEAASQRYFGKSARAVTLGEAAMLAGLVRSPSKLAPNRNPTGAAERAAVVLAEMAAQGYASERDAVAARLETTGERKATRPGAGNYLADWVMDILDDHIGTIEQDVVVRTTIDRAMQDAAEKALVGTLDAKGTKAEVGQGALVAMAPDGAVKAMVGGRDYAKSQFNRAVSAKRQPGSAFKPFVYLAALEAGLTGQTVRDDTPLNIKGWQPSNYTHKFMGPVPLDYALAHSINTVAVRLGLEVGAKTVARAAQRLGINAPLQANASLALGTSEVSPLEIATAYAAFANGGTGAIPYAIARVEAADGNVIYDRKPVTLGRVIEPDVAGQMNALLRGVVVNGTGKKADIPGWMVAGKTGTTQDNKDAWFVGYTSQLVAAVWLGNDDGEETNNVTGSGLPVDVFAQFMRVALKGQKPQPLPGIERAPAIANVPPLPEAAGRPVSLQAPGTAPAPVVPAGAPQAAAGPSARDRGLFSRLFESN